MPISDLTGTTWVINNTINDFPGDSFAINFTSNGNNYTHFNPTSEAPGELIIWLLVYWDATFAGTTVYNSGIWVNDNYKTIEITGGTDVTNANLISWLQSNATQVVEPSASMSIGTSSISKILFGNTEVSKVFLGSVKVYEKSTPVPTLINFYIDDQATTAEQGMSWFEWVSSNYNTEGYVCNGDYGYVHNASYTKKVVLSNVDIEGRNIIVENGDYDLVRDSG